jgi:hypothetical protein
MRTEGGGVGISASLFRPRSSVLRYIYERFIFTTIWPERLYHELTVDRFLDSIHITQARLN